MASDENRPALWSWALYDWGNSAFSSIVATFVFPAYFIRSVATNEVIGSSQWGLTIGLSGLILALMSPMLGAIADQTGRRKGWIALFTIITVVSTGLLWFVAPSASCVPLALGLIAIAMVAAEASFIFYNAMLPALAPPDKVGRWSGIGWGLGYVGGVFSLLAALYGLIDADTSPFDLNRDAAQHVRATFVLCAGWVLVFAVPLLLFTPKEPLRAQSLWKASVLGWRQLIKTSTAIRTHLNLVRFFIARMLYVDGLATLFAFGGVYAAGMFHMSEQNVLIFGIALNVTAGLGALVFGRLDDAVGSKRLIVGSLIGLTVFAAGALLTTSENVFWICGLILGIFVGPVQASSRAYLAKMAPKEIRNEVFGFFIFSGKASSFVGPLLIAWLTSMTGNQQIAMSSILAFFIAGTFLVLTIEDDRHVVKND
jgi:UMF1 family MFS transporter